MELYLIASGFTVNRKNEAHKSKATVERPVNLSYKHYISQFVYVFHRKQCYIIYSIFSLKILKSNHVMLSR